jgi:hypothetical protein
MNQKPDWDAYAVKMANQAMKMLPPGARSVALDKVAEPKIVVEFDASGRALPPDARGLGIAVFFGTDGYLQNPRSRAQVHVIRQCLAVKGIDVLGFGTNDRRRPLGRGWALVVRSDDLKLLGTIVNAAYAHGFCTGTVIEESATDDFGLLDLDPDAIPIDLNAFAG